MAKSLGVDPYTTNPVLAQKLTDTAWVAFWLDWEWIF